MTDFYTSTPLPHWNRRLFVQCACAVSIYAGSTTSVAASQALPENFHICGELHPEDSEIQEVERILAAEASGVQLRGKEAAVLRLHPKWGRWAPARIQQGRPLRIAFMQENHPLNDVVIEAAREWQRHMDLGFEIAGTFRTRNDPGNLDILVTQNATGNSSYLGVASRVYANSGRASLRLQQFYPEHTRKQIFGVALHELGHALGLIHEHQNPGAKLNFDEVAVLRYYNDKYRWDEEKTRQNVLSQYGFGGAHKVDLRTSFDPRSIMMYALPGTVFADGSSGFTSNDSLSVLDASLIDLVY